MAKLTPMMQQYRETKNRYPDCLLLFRVGDFYELFFEDAQLAARELSITLTSRDGNKEEGIPMAGVPHHALDTYLARLVRKGFKVAICDQVEDPREAKGLVKRAITRIVTPGTIIEDNLLEAADNNWLAAVANREGQWGLAYCDISTGQFHSSQLSSRERLDAALLALQPGEIIVEKGMSAGWGTAILSPVGSTDMSETDRFIPGDFTEHAAPRQAVAMLIAYLRDKQQQPEHLSPLEWQQLDKFLYLDSVTQRNLELLSALDGSVSPSLLSVLNHTRTSMGGRRMKNLIVTPLTDIHSIENRLDAVEYLLDNYIIRKQAEELLRGFYDLERIVTRIGYGTANGRDMLALGASLNRIPQLQQVLADMPDSFSRHLDPCSQLCSTIEQAIHPNPPNGLREGNLIRPGWSNELDQLRQLAAGGSAWIRSYENDLRSKHSIKSLKVGYNKVFGYYIEVTKSNLELVPDYFVRKQTLVNCERFITPELKEWEDKILSANERMLALEYQLFSDIRTQANNWTRSIQGNARVIAMLDCFLSLAQVAEERNYCRPTLTTRGTLDIKNGRHPVVEVYGDEEFVPNDCLLDNQERQILIITGPNMAGKSTYMRQVALIALMAHMGSFVPADAASIGVLDGIYTRIGASDELAAGRSTFMVEMSELAGILANATSRSLILLDEIGRGTGTDDGISIARSTIEYLHQQKELAAKTLFATHYHQLIGLSETLERVKNVSVLVSEREGEVTFLHKIAEGGSDRSYGIHVARLAGLPEQLVAQAQRYLEEENNSLPAATQLRDSQQHYSELKALLEELARQDPDGMSPRQAWQMLARLHSRASQVKEVLGHED